MVITQTYKQITNLSDASCVLANGSEELGVREEVLGHRHDRRLVSQDLVVVPLEIQSGQVQVGTPPEEVHVHYLEAGPNLDCG